MQRLALAATAHLKFSGTLKRAIGWSDKNGSNVVVPRPYLTRANHVWARVVVD